MGTAKSRNKHVAKISCDKVVTALLKLSVLMQTSWQRIHKLEYLCDYIIVYLSHLFLPKALLRESIMFLWRLNAINDSFIGVRVATVKFSLTWQMSTLCPLSWTYIIILCNLHAFCDFYQAFKVGHRCNTKTVKRRHKSCRGVWGVLPQKMFKFGDSETLFLAVIMRYVSEKSTSNLKMANNCKSL